MLSLFLGTYWFPRDIYELTLFSARFSWDYRPKSKPITPY